MNNIKRTVEEFLIRHGMYYQSIEAKQCVRDFQDEMERGLCGGQGSLQMIPTYIMEGEQPETDRPVIVIDVGGTNVRVALVSFGTDGSPAIRDFYTYKTPGIDREISCEAFYSRIADCLDPVIGQSDAIGFCFSFATLPLADRDARVLAGGKQLKVRGLIGSKVGAGLRTALEAKGVRAAQKSIVVLNDSVAAMLGGLSATKSRRFSGHIGFILGTGTNICYAEQLAKIKKLHSPALSGRMVINVESCGYNNFPAGDIDRAFDRGLIDSGIDLYEKMVSGKYQGGLMYHVLTAAAADGLFSEFFRTALEVLSDLGSKEIDLFLSYPHGQGRLAGCCADDRDRTTLYYLCDAINERSSLLCAIVLCAVLRKAEIGTDPCLPAFVTVEGSTFYGSENFRSKFRYYVRTLLGDTYGLYASFHRIEDATLVGTAIAGLA